MFFAGKRAFLGAASVLVLSGLAAAQESTPPPATDDGQTIEKVVVTAQKRAERDIDVPINVTTYTGRFFEDHGISDFESISAFIPGLVVQEQSPNNPGFVIRGLTSDSGESNIEPRVSIYQDGVSISRSRGSIVELYDLERIEVLKGPQSTLFGRSALIGAINLVQNKASNDTYGNLTVGGGDNGQFLARGMYNTPIIEDSLYLRMAATTRTKDGIVDNVLPAGVTGPSELSGMDMWAGRAAMRYETAGATFDLIGNYQKNDNPGTAFKSSVVPAFGGTTNPFTHASLNSFGGFEGGRDLSTNREVYGATLIGNIDLGEQWTLTTVSAARRFSSLEVFDADGSAFSLLLAAEDAEGTDYSQELRVNFDGERVQAFAGINIAKEDGSQRAPLATDERQFAAWNRGAPLVPAALFQSGDPNQLTPFLGAFPFKPLHIEEFENRGETTAFDVFGDVTFNVTETVSLTGGLRWSQEDKTTSYYGRAVNGPSALAQFLSGGLVSTLAVANTNGAVVSDSETFDGLTWRLIAEYTPSETANFYASYARGRRPEVIDVADVNSVGTFAGFAVLPSETVDSFEVGAKGILMDGRLSLQGSAFYYLYDNYQTTQNNALTLFPEFVNAGSATSYGIEAQFRVVLAKGVSAFGTYAWNRGRFDSDSVFADNQFRLAPDHSGSLGLDAMIEFDDIALFVRPTWTWKSEVFFEEDNDPRFYQGAFGLVNLRVGAEFVDGKYVATLFGTNLLDEEFLIDAGNTGDTIGSPTFIRGNPRMMGAELTARF